MKPKLNPPLIPFKQLLGQYNIPERKPDHRFSALVGETRMAANAWHFETGALVFFMVKSADEMPAPEDYRTLVNFVISRLGSPEHIAWYLLHRDRLVINVMNRRPQ